MAEAWKDVMHRQAYLHCEMLQELIEVLFPIPMTVLLYWIQFSPTGEKVELAPMLVNCGLQVGQEFVADCMAIFWGNSQQNKFYRVAATNLFRGYNYPMMVMILVTVAYATNGFYFATYLKVGKTHAGDYVSLI